MFERLKDTAINFTAGNLRVYYPQSRIREALTILDPVFQASAQITARENLASAYMIKTFTVETENSRIPTSLYLCSDYIYSTVVSPTRIHSSVFLREGQLHYFLANFYIYYGMIIFNTVLMVTDTQTSKGKDASKAKKNALYTKEIGLPKNLNLYQNLYESDNSGRQLEEAIIQDGVKIARTRKISGVYLDCIRTGLNTTAEIFTKILPIANSIVDKNGLKST